MKLNYKNNSAGICITAITDGGDICHGFFLGAPRKTTSFGFLQSLQSFFWVNKIMGMEDPVVNPVPSSTALTPGWLIVGLTK
jgi:hypothetical protein